MSILPRWEPMRMSQLETGYSSFAVAQPDSLSFGTEAERLPRCQTRPPGDDLPPGALSHDGPGDPACAHLD